MLDCAQPRAPMHCHFVVPDLFWPASVGAEPYRGLELPALELAFARGRGARTAGGSLERWFVAAYGLGSGLPLAPFTLRGDGGDPGPHGWMRADPVHLKVHGDRLVLADASRLALRHDEARDLVAALNRHFGTEGITFLAPHPQRWYVRMDVAPGVRTAPTAEIAGKGIEPFMPAGEEGARWRRFINEAQMLLHEHPCNVAREARGELAVNSVWVWGAGHEQAVAARFAAVWSDDPLAAGLAQASGVPIHRLPESGAALLDEPRPGTALVALAAPAGMAYGEIAAWREAVLEIERQWFAPLVQGLKGPVLESLTVHGLGADFGHTVELDRHHQWQFWRRGRPLEAYAA